MIPAETRQLVLARDKERCVACGTTCYGKRYSIHHRKLRSQGGTNDPVNLILLCGSGTQGCHGQVHSQRLAVGLPGGFIVPSYVDPAVIPVRHHALGLVLLTTDGGVEQVAA